jgi:hypothetical protein
MNAEFQQFVESLEPKYQRLMAMAPVRYGTLPRLMPDRGIYLFSEADRNLYVGRTNPSTLERALPAEQHAFSATFAFRIAREETGMLKVSYSKAGSRASLMADANFGPPFSRAKSRLGAMDLRFIEKTDSIRQALLEIYVAVTLKMPYNDFNNH